jgi:hypothetical protein
VHPLDGFDRVGLHEENEGDIMNEGEQVLSPVLTWGIFDPQKWPLLGKEEGSPQRDSNPCYLREREVS